MTLAIRYDIVNAIDKAVEAAHTEEPRQHLGGSVLGEECMRKAWYLFRWAAQETFEGRMLRLFQRGHHEEDVFVEALRKTGARVVTVDPKTGKQFRYTRFGGHMGGSQDAGITNVPHTIQGKWFLGEFKTHNFDSFRELAGTSKKVKGVIEWEGGIGVRASKPKHFAQCQIYMHWSGLRTALYFAVCKDDDHIYVEEIEYDEAYAIDAEKRGEVVVQSEDPPPKIPGARDASFFKCMFCPAKMLCHAQAFANVNCRTCAHSTPELDGNARWTCAKKGIDLTFEAQQAGCSDHVYNPAFLVNHGEYIQGNEEGNYAEYRTKEGGTFRNGTRNPDPGAPVFSSLELPHTPFGVDRRMLEVRSRFSGEFAEPVEVTDADKAINKALAGPRAQDVKAPKLPAKWRTG